MNPYTRPFKFNTSQRDRLKEFPGYHAATLFRQFNLPLILRHPFYDGGPPVVNPRNLSDCRYHEGFLPVMTQRKPMIGQGPLRDPLDARSKVVSIPIVDRKLRTKRAIPKLEAKGTKAKAFQKGKHRKMTNESSGDKKDPHSIRIDMDVKVQAK